MDYDNYEKFPCLDKLQLWPKSFRSYVYDPNGVEVNRAVIQERNLVWDGDRLRQPAALKYKPPIPHIDDNFPIQLSSDYVEFLEEIL